MSTGSPDNVPGVFWLVTLFASILVSLGSGTNYIYSAYAPQLGACLQVSHTQLNIIGLAGNCTYLSGPVWGRIVDHKGPRVLLASASICLLIGYLGIRRMYDDCMVDGLTVSALRLALLVVCSFMTGLGGCAGLSAALNVTAKSFSASSRATTTALVMSGFGLSAFLFSLISNTLFPGDVSSLLLTLAIGTATPMFIGLLVIKPVPLPSTALNVWNASGTDGRDSIPSEDGAIIGGPQVTLGPVEDREVVADSTPLLSHRRQNSSYQALALPSTIEVDPPASLLPKTNINDRDILPDIHGTQLWLSSDFYLVFTIMAICTGTGLMYINNVGSISHALYAKMHPVHDEIEASKWQIAQVSILSLGSFAARILIGLYSDFTHTRFHLPRAYCFCIVSFLFIISQAAAIAVSSVETLWVATLLVGLGYGAWWGSYVSVIIEWFGLAHVSENLGFVSFSPIVGGNLFSLMLGYSLDTHKKTQPSLLMRNWPLMLQKLQPEHQCSDGKACYVGSLQVTLVACIVALGLSWWAGIREGQKLRSRNVYVEE